VSTYYKISLSSSDGKAFNFLLFYEMTLSVVSSLQRRMIIQLMNNILKLHIPSNDIIQGDS
jgi:hypothetical protein